MDPHAVLGLRADATAAEVRAAYRREAKRWHPDRGAGEAGTRRMLLVNAAYARLRDAPNEPPGERPAHPGGDARAPAAAGEAEDVRAALGAELLRELEADEPVEIVVPAATWASPQTLLVLTDRRLLWLLDDAPVGRVRTLPLPAVAGARLRRGRLRRSAGVAVRDRAGRRTVFTGLAEPTARTVVRRLQAAGARG